MADPTYRLFAERARSEADAATLDNVRDRALRCEAAWLAIAERHERLRPNRAGNASIAAVSN